MTNGYTNAGEPGQEELATLEQSLICQDPGDELLRAYYEAAVATRRFSRAKNTLKTLQGLFPGNHNVRSMFIALCLQHNDLSSAMDAIETLVAFSKPDDGLIDSSLSVRSKIGPREIDECSSSGPTLSVCMIVKNEQVRLAPCLNAVKTAADEIIVVDTGSTDRTADIARIFGARVFNFDWQDDFSAARNYSLQKANADWVLMLDADEIISARDLAVLKNMIQFQKNRQIVFSIETRNYTNVANALHWQANAGQYPQQEAGLGWFPSQKIRLFPRSQKIFFRFPVHELVEPSVKAADIPIVKSNIPIHHYGHLNETKNKQKALAYFKIGYAKLEQLGHDVAALRELAVQAGQLEYWSEALGLWQRLIRIRPEFTEAYVNMAGASWQIGNYRQALYHAQQAIRLDPALKEAYFNLAVSHLMLERADLAERCLSSLVAKHGDYLAARFMLGVACCASGDLPRANSMLLELAASPAGPSLDMAIRDLTQRFQKAGLKQYADVLARCAAALPNTEKDA